MIIRTAKPGEAQYLSDLAVRSKAYWGYDASFMDLAKDDLTVSEKNILEDRVHVLEDAGKVIGFFCITTSENTNELDAMFIEPEHIGKGFGKVIWEGIVETARAKGIQEFIVISDPNAEEFYLRMGAIRIGEYKSTIFEGRKLPMLKVVVDN